MISFGNSSGAVAPFAPLILSLKCVTVCRPKFTVYVETKEEFDSYATELMSMLTNGHLKISISGIYELENVGKAHSDLEECYP